MDSPRYEANKEFYFLVKDGNVSGLEVIDGYTYVVNNGGNTFRSFARRIDAINYLQTIDDDNYYVMTAGEENQVVELYGNEIIE